MKKCSKCGRVLEENMFNKNKYAKDGLQSWCKDCKAEYASLHNKQHKMSIFNFNSIPIPFQERVFEVKICKKCGQELPIAAFWKNRKNKDGLQNWCKKCQTEYEKQRKQSLKEMKKDKNEKAKLVFVGKPTFSFFNWTDIINKYIKNEKELSIPLNKLKCLYIENEIIKIKYIK